MYYCNYCFTEIKQIYYQVFLFISELTPPHKYKSRIYYYNVWYVYKLYFIK